MTDRTYLRLSATAPVLHALALAWFHSHPGAAFPCRINGRLTIVLDDRKETP